MAGDIRFFSAGPLSALAIILLIGLALLLIPLFVLGLIGAAFMRLGLSWIAALALVLLMLAGSFVNIPLHRIRRDMIHAPPLDSAGNELAGSFAHQPVWETVISVNFGGAIVPSCIALFMVHQATVTGTILFIPVTICTALVMAVSFVFTREIAGIGIRVPVIVPALAALLAGIFLSGEAGVSAAVTALAGGTFGALAGGNLAHLFHVRDLEVREVSIGGSGTFGAVFLCCVLPALIA